MVPETEVQPESNSTAWKNLSKHTLHTMAGHMHITAVLAQNTHRSAGCRLSFLLHLFWSSAASCDSPNLFIFSLTPSHHVFLACSLCLILPPLLYNSTRFDPMSTTFTFHMSKPSRSILLNYQTNWIQTHQFSKPCAFLSLFKPTKPTHPPDHAHFSSA